MNPRTKHLLALMLLTASVAVFVCPVPFNWNRLVKRSGERPSLEQMLDYFARRNSSNCRLYYEFGGVLNRSPSLTFYDGQKAVCMDAAVAPVPGRCLVYSFGNNGEWSFDDQMAEFGCHVHVFDPSVYSWNHRRSNRTWFYRIGVSGSAESRNAKGWRMMTLQAIRRQLGHQNVTIDYLIMDIEGDEWTILSRWLAEWTPQQWNQIKQLALEVHLGNPSEMVVQYHVIRRLEDLAFTRFFSRENPWSRSPDLNDTATCYEIAWFNRNYLTN